MRNTLNFSKLILVYCIISFCGCNPETTVTPQEAPSVLGEWDLVNIQLTVSLIKNGSFSGSYTIDDDGTGEETRTKPGKVIFNENGEGYNNISSYYLYNQHFSFFDQGEFVWNEEGDEFVISQEGLDQPSVWKRKTLNDTRLEFTWLRFEEGGPYVVRNAYTLTLGR